MIAGKNGAAPRTPCRGDGDAVPGNPRIWRHRLVLDARAQTSHAARRPAGAGRAGERRDGGPAGYARSISPDSARCRPRSPSASIRRSTASCRRCCSPRGSTSRRATCWPRSIRALFQAALDQAKAEEGAGRGAAHRGRARTSRAPRRWCIKNVTSQQIVDQQQAKVDQLKASIAADEATIETAQTQLDYTSIVAPSDGRIGVRLVDPGNIVHANDQGSLATLVLTQPSAVHVHVAGAVARRHARRHGARAGRGRPPSTRTTAAALATGKLLLVDNVDRPDHRDHPPQGDVSQRRRAGCGRANSSTRACCSRPAANALVVPSAAVQRGPNGLFVWIVDRQRHWPSRVRSRSARPTGELTDRHLGPRGRRARRHRRAIQAAARRAGHHAAPPVAGAGATREPLRAIHPAAGRDLAADGGAGLRRLVAYPVPAGRRRCRRSTFPTIQVTANFQGASAETMASSVAAPARAAVRADPRRHPADLD